MPLSSVFQGVQGCRLPGLKPPKRFQPSRRPPRQQLLQLHAPAIDFIFQGVQDCRLPGLKPSKRFRRLPRQQLLQLHTCPCHLFFRGFKPALTPSERFRRLPRQQLLQLHVPAICFSGGSRLPFARPQTPQTLPTLPQASKATTLTYSYYMPLPSVFQGVQDCGLPGLKPPKRFQPSRRPPRQQLLQLLHAPAICFSGGSRLPFARPQTPQTLPTLPQASKATTLTATCPCHLFFRGFKTAVCLASNPPNASAGFQGNNSYSYIHAPAICFSGGSSPPSHPPNASAGFQGNNSYSYMSLPSVFQGVQVCRLPGLKPPKRFQPSRRPPRQQLLQLHAPAIYFSRGSRLPFARPQTPQTLPTLPQASKATTLTATTCPCHLFFRGFKTAVCPASNPQNASNPPAGLQGNNSYSYMPLPSIFQGVQDCRLRQQLLQLLHAPVICFSGGSRLPFARPQTRRPPRQQPRQQLLQLHAPAICFSGGSRLPFARPQTPKRFQPSRRPPRQQLLQLHAPAIYFSRGSRLPFAWPQTLQTLPQASKATTLTATYMPLPSVFQGVQARPHTLQTLPQASKATTLTATCPCHLFFRGFKTPVCPASNPPNASNPPAGLQGNNSYLTATTCPCHLFFRGFKTAVCPASNPPNASNPPAGLQGNNSYSPSLFLSLSLCLSLSLSLALSHFFFGNWTLSWGLHPVAGRSWKTRSTKHELFSGSYESQEERDVICCGIPSKQSWLLRLWSPGAVLVKFQVAYPCFFGNTKARSCVSLTI